MVYRKNFQLGKRQQIGIYSNYKNHRLKPIRRNSKDIIREYYHQSQNTEILRRDFGNKGQWAAMQK